MDEYIKRDDVLKIRYSSGYECDGVLYVPFKDITKGLNKIPAADVRENVRGKWIVDEDGNIECSVCGRNGVGDSFCEHCGADLRGEKDS